MTESEQEPCELELISSLRADYQPVEAGARERVAARLTSSVGALSINRPLASSQPWSLARVLSLAGSFVIGGLCGAGLYGELRAPAPGPVVYVERPALSAVPPALPLPNARVAVSAEPAPPR